MRKALLFLSVFVFSSCHRHWLGPTIRRLPAASPYKGMPTVDFCQLPRLAHQLVNVRGLYYGVANEYYSFTPSETACALSLELTYSDQVQAPFQAKFDSLRRHNERYCLVVDALGRYENDQPQGYGQLGHNKAQFVVQELVQVQLVTLKRRKVVAVE